MAAFGKVGLQQQLSPGPQIPSQIAHNVQQVLLGGVILRGRCLLGLQYGGTENEIQQRPALQVLLWNIVLGRALYIGHDLSFFRGENLPQQAGGEQGVHVPVVEVPAFLPLPKVQLQLPHGVQERVDGAVPHGVAHGNVNAVVLRRNGIEQRQQQGFIRQHKSGFHVVCRRLAADLFQNPRRQFGLSYRRRHAYHTDDRLFQPFRVRYKGGRKVLDVLGQEQRRLVLPVLDFFR